MYGYFTLAAAAAAVAAPSAPDPGQEVPVPRTLGDDELEVGGLFEEPGRRGDPWAEVDSERRFRGIGEREGTPAIM
jgi:hypothetical protein